MGYIHYISVWHLLCFSVPPSLARALGDSGRQFMFYLWWTGDAVLCRSAFRVLCAGMKSVSEWLAEQICISCVVCTNEVCVRMAGWTDLHFVCCVHEWSLSQNGWLNRSAFRVLCARMKSVSEWLAEQICISCVVCTNEVCLRMAGWTDLHFVCCVHEWSLSQNGWLNRSAFRVLCARMKSVSEWLAEQIDLYFVCCMHEWSLSQNGWLNRSVFRVLCARMKSVSEWMAEWMIIYNVHKTLLT